MLASLLGGDRLLKSLDLFVNRPDVDAAGYRRLRADEVSQLERTFNTSPNWGDILVAVDFDGISRVRGCHFDGRIFLNSFLSDINIGNGIYLPSGLLNSNFKGCCFLDLDCIVRNTTVVCNVVMGRCSCLLDCGAVLCEGSSAFGNGEVVLLGPENCGGRKVPIFVGADYGDLCRLALDRKNRGLRIATDINCSEAVCAVKLAFSVLGEHAQLVRNDMIKNVILGPYCSISSSSLCSCTVVSSESAPAIISSGSYITACILSGSNKVKGPCEIQHSMLMDCAAVSTGALVSHCIVGPDSSVGGAECLHSIIGPFTGVHHASLVISCMWPTGRGNVAYGAMAANHTGRLNDQEGLSGEGCFYGLGVQLKYPFNTLSAPYSLFAAGTICLPQRIAFPFSLISSSDVPISVEVSNASFSPALNVIRPGWVIYSSPYTLVRSMSKVKSRRKSQLYRTDHELWRPWLLFLLLCGRNRLQSILNAKSAILVGSCRVYTEKDDAGLGKNIMYERDRALGEEAYSRALRKYALEVVLGECLKNLDCGQSLEQYLHGLRKRVLLVSNDYGKFYENQTSDLMMVLEDLDFLYPMRTRQQHAAKTTNVLSALDIICIILFEEYHLEILNDLKGWVERMMNDLVVEIDWHRNRVMQCKERDSIRGRQIISDYDIVHGTEAATGESSFCSTPIDDILSIVDESASTAKADVLSLRNALLHSLMS